MKVFQVTYFAKGLQRVSIVVAKSVEQAEKMVYKDLDRKMITNLMVSKNAN